MDYKYCTNCGKRIKANVKFCPYCGSKQINSPNNTPTKSYTLNQRYTPKSNKPSSASWLWLMIGYILPLILGDGYTFVFLTTPSNLNDLASVNSFYGLFGIIIGLIQLSISIIFIFKFKKQYISIKYISIILLIVSLLFIIYCSIFFMKNT